MQPRYERMLGFWTLTLSRPQSAAVTPSGNSISRLPIRLRPLPLACLIVSVTRLLPTVSVRECSSSVSLAPGRAHSPGPLPPGPFGGKHDVEGSAGSYRRRSWGTVTVVDSLVELPEGSVHVIGMT